LFSRIVYEHLSPTAKGRKVLTSIAFHGNAVVCDDFLLETTVGIREIFVSESFSKRVVCTQRL
jgi:hypothetical protein